MDFPARIVEAAREHDGGAAGAITRESLLSAQARIEGTPDASPSPAADLDAADDA